MYIGTNLAELSGISSKTDKISFTFDISTRSIPLLKRYGFDIKADTFLIEDVLAIELPDIIGRLSDGELKYKSFDLDLKNKKIDVNISYINGDSLNQTVDLS